MFSIEGQSAGTLVSVVLTGLFIVVVLMFAGSYLFFRYRATLLRNRQFAQLLQMLDRSRKRDRSIDWGFVDSQIQSIPWLRTQVSEFFEQCWTEDGVRFNNEQAGHYLREEEMYPRDYQWMESIPERLPGIGILGTFVGIIIGLMPLAATLGGTAGGDGASQEVAEQAAEMASATSQLVMGLLISFTTSVFALLFAIVLGYMQRGVNGALDAHRLRLIEWLNTNVQRVVTPQVLTLLLKEQRAQSEAQAERAANTVQLVEEKILPVLEDQLEQQRHILDKVHESIEAAIQSSGLVSAVNGMASTIAKTQAEGMGEVVDHFLETIGSNFGDNFNSLGESIDGMIRSNDSYQQNMGALVDSLATGIQRQLEAAGVVEQTVRASSESVDKVLSVVEGLDGGAQQIQGAAQQMNDAIANQRQALSEQQQLNASVLDAMQAQSARWTTEREASAEAYAQLASQFSALSTTLDKLIQWHDRVHGELNAQVVTWRSAIDAQSQLTGTVHEERKQWSTLVHSLGDASTNLRHITDSLGRWASTMQGLADTMQTDLTALSQTQQSGHDGLAAIGDKLQRIGSSMGDSWENYATIASSLSESLPDVATLLEGLTQAVSTQQQIVIEARTVAETFKETGTTQAQLKDGLTQLVTASSDANRALVPTAKSLGDAASTLDKLTLRLQAQDDETRRTSQQLSSAVKTMSERDAAFKSQWTGVTQALERTSAGFQKSVSEYENSVSSTVEKTFKQFDTELASSVDKLKGAVQAMHGLVERIDAMVEELTDR